MSSKSIIGAVVGVVVVVVIVVAVAVHRAPGPNSAKVPAGFPGSAATANPAQKSLNNYTNLPPGVMPPGPPPGTQVRYTR
ncbi:MAG TPA: hypothetical protein VFW40_06020 [Capsulimonadaceae bacterium]|nr:hypothetical protein [Capsulimonadaceae bacterium]